MTYLGHSLIALLFAFTGSAQAKVIQILHTNDLHASLNVAGAAAVGEKTYGGWAQIKTVMDQLTESAKSQNIDTVRLDAGDFLEGTLSYFPDHGLNVLKAFQSMGYDAAALGNHDWLMGAENTDDSFGKSPFPFPVLSANSKFSPYLENLNKQIIPSTQIIRDGIKIGIVGVSTDEVFYKWITKVDSYKNDMKILDYRDFLNSKGEVSAGIANDEAAELHEKNDLVIALTHIGLKEDKKLAASSSNIDLIVGGHSHTILDSLALIENTKGDMVPIVQAGVTGVFVGKILVDVEPGKKPTVLTYELVPVSHSAPADTTVATLLQNSEKRVSDLFGTENLNKVIGHSDSRLTPGSNGATPYSKFIVDAMRDSTGADLALDLGEFHGNSAQEGGEITKRKLMEMYPRKLNVEQNEGLYVYEFKIPGWALKLALKLVVQFGYDLSISGLDYKTIKMTDQDFLDEKNSYAGTWKAKALTPYQLDTHSILIDGRPLKLLKNYRVAAPEFIVRGAYAISFLTRLVMLGGKPTPLTVWDVSEQYLTKIKNIKDEPSLLAASTTDPNGEYPFGKELLDALLKKIQSNKALH